MFPEVRAVRREEHDRAVKRAAVALDDPHDEVDGVGPRVPAKRVHRRARDVDAALPISPEVFTAFVGTRAVDGAEVESSGIGGHEGLRKEDQPRAPAGRLAGKDVHLPEGPLTVECDRRRLHDRDGESLRQGFHSHSRITAAYSNW